MTVTEGAQPTPYGKRIGNVGGWCASAEDLLFAATALRPKLTQYWRRVAALHEGPRRRFPKNNPHRVYFMLIAFALENLLKAAVVRNNASSYAQAQRLPKSLNEHDLVVLARRAGLRLNQPDRELLERLTRDAKWFGRYPVPVEPLALRAHISYGADDSDKLLALVQRVRDELSV